MSRFKQLKDSAFKPEDKPGPIRPAIVVDINPGDFADEYEKKPRSKVVAGLRLLPADEDSVAQKQAARVAVEKFPKPEQYEERVQEYKDAFIAWCVARSLCDPNDVTKPHPKFLMAEDTIRSILTNRGLVRVFDEIERHHIESSPLYPEASDEDIDSLSALLAVPDAVAILPEAQAARFRRYAHFLLSELLDAQSAYLID